MRVKSVRAIGRRNVYDISVQNAEHYILENGVVTHNTGPYYSGDNIYIIGRQQEKKADDPEILGYDFIINVEKSRYVKEKAKIPIEVRYDGGISQWSGLLDMALESGNVIKPNLGWYSRVDSSTGEIEDKKWRKAETHNAEFWRGILKDKKFKDWIKETYALSGDSMYKNHEVLIVNDEGE